MAAFQQLQNYENMACVYTVLHADGGAVCICLGIFCLTLRNTDIACIYKKRNIINDNIGDTKKSNQTYCFVTWYITRDCGMNSGLEIIALTNINAHFLQPFGTHGTHLGIVKNKFFILNEKGVVWMGEKILN